MSTLSRLLAFVVLLVAVSAGAALAGDRLGPDRSGAGGGHTRGTSGQDHGAPQAGEDHGARAGEQEHGASSASSPSGVVPGLAVSQDGLRLDLQRTPSGVSFRIIGRDDRPVRDFDVEQDRRMHLIVVRRDMRHFQHVHPRLAPDGTWSVALRLPAAGSYRAFADFRVAGRQVTLGTDLHEPGPFTPGSLPAPAPVSRVDGYEVAIDPEDLSFSVGRPGRKGAVAVEPYLGARGHLVALREGDLAYLHVHPRDEARAGETIGFDVDYPTAGRYRLFLQFKAGGRVHTAAFTREVLR